VVALVVSTCLSAPQAFAGEPDGGVEVMTAGGEHLTGAAATREYDALRQQPSINCGSCRKFVVIDAEKMRYIARNINMAFHSGKPFLLHRVEDKTIIRANRYKACVGAGFHATTAAVAMSTPLRAVPRAAPVRRRRKYPSASRDRGRHPPGGPRRCGGGLPPRDHVARYRSSKQRDGTGSGE
jgi:hypothetical protein